MTITDDQLKAYAAQIRVDGIRMSTAAGSGHPTSSLSATDLMTVLLTKYLHYDFNDPKNPANDHLIFSKGHASPLYYAMYRAAGVISEEEMMTYRQFGSRLEGHPVPVLPFVDVATGSLGQGLPIAVGVALAGKYLDKLPYHVWVLLGDSEMAEGSIWEALDKASFYKLNNLIGILDMNRLGQRGPTELQWDGDAYAARAQAFGWHTVEIDGHDFDQIDKAYKEALAQTDKPTLIIARTIKGKGVPEIEDKPNWHGKALPPEMAEKAIAALGGITHLTFEIAKPEQHPRVVAAEHDASKLKLPTYGEKDKVATRKAYGDALVALAAYPDVVVLDAEVSNSTHSEEFKAVAPDRFFEMYIAEQQMIAAGVGFAVRERVSYSSTFAAFLTRAYDFIRMAAISRANIRLSGSHAGVSIGEDGPSQMALEDLSMMRSIHGSTVLYPSDPNQAVKLVVAMADQPGISYIRTTRAALPTLYSADEDFPIGGSKVLRQSDSDTVTIISAGITLHEALKAADTLKADGVNVRVIDLYSVKPIDSVTLHEAAAATGGRFVVVEDHWPQGGLGEAVLSAFTVGPDGGGAMNLQLIELGVRNLSSSGTPAELLNAAGIDAPHILDAVKSFKQ